MDKAGLLRSIAETGYNVGFGAKKHFATFDMAQKGPGWIGFISLTVGAFGLYVDMLSAKGPSATLLVAGVVALYMSFYRVSEYEEAGKELTLIFNGLRDLYRSVEAGASVDAGYSELKALEARYYPICISKQMLFSDLYAHYKFFAQHQIGWIDDQLHFTWRDKFPLLARVAIIGVFLATFGAIVAYLI